MFTRHYNAGGISLLPSCQERSIANYWRDEESEHDMVFRGQKVLQPFSRATHSLGTRTTPGEARSHATA
jgi:hypothetical protein